MKNLLIMSQQNNLTKELNTLLNTGDVQLTSEHDTIEIVQRLRKNGFNMELVDFDLVKFMVWVKN